MAKSRNYNQNRGWDPMREDFDNMTYDPQYADEESNVGDVELDQCRLYVRNVPKNVNEEGLRSIFSKYGTLHEMFLSHDPNKRYALVSYEAPGEAKLAMTNLNKMEPLKLLINIAHKKRMNNSQYQTNNKRPQQHDRHAPKERRSHADTTSICGSVKGVNNIRKEEAGNSDKHMNDSFTTDTLLDLSLTDNLDPEMSAELEQLQLEYLRLQEAQVVCKTRMILKRNTGKQFLNGSKKNLGMKVVIPNSDGASRSVIDTVHGSEGDLTAAAGDTVNLPALQSEASRACMACGRNADLFCGRCGVMPYCGIECQRKDWLAKHSLTCIPSPRLASPAVQTKPPTSPMKQMKHRNNEGSDKGKKTYPNNNNKPYPNNNNHNNKPNYNNNNTATTKQGQYNNKKPYNQNVTIPQDPKPTNDRDNWDDATVINSPSQRDTSPKLRRPYTQKTEEKLAPVATPEVAAEPAARVTPATRVTPAARLTAAARVAPAAQVTPAAPQPAKSLDVMQTPCSQKLVPSKYLVETLSVGDTFLLSVDKLTSQCRVNAPGFVCLSMHVTQEVNFELLCSDYFEDCIKEESFKPSVGETFSLHNKTDGAWYRARCVSPTHCALLDSGSIEPIDDAKCVRLADKYKEIPEFYCVLEPLDADVKIEQSLQATIQSKSPRSIKVTLQVVDTGAKLGEALVSRWIPTLDLPAEPKVELPAAVVAPSAEGVCVPRPPVKTNTRVNILDATETSRVFVCNADQKTNTTIDNIICEVALYGKEAKPFTEPLKKGQIVVAKFDDGVHHRAMCLRTNVKMNRYKLEFIEFGNIHIAKLEDIYPCPSRLDLNAYPVLTSQVTLKMSKGFVFNEQVLKYVNELKEQDLLLTIPSGESCLPSGCEVSLTVEGDNQSVNEKIELMSHADWDKIGTDEQIEKPMYSTMKYLALDDGESDVVVLDVSGLPFGSVAMARADHPMVEYAHKELSALLLEYSKSELGSQQYLPCLEELCVVQSPADGQWYRAALCHMESAGSPTVTVAYLDYGNVEDVPTSALRKMPPSIVRAAPAVAVQVEIKDFPTNPTPAQLEAAITHMGMKEADLGKLRITACKMKEFGFYIAEAPSLLNAVNNA